jgi:hypothetical protein
VTAFRKIVIGAASIMALPLAELVRSVDTSSICLRERPHQLVRRAGDVADAGPE